MEYQTIEVERDGHVLTITLNQAQTMNALGRQMLDEVGAVVTGCELDRDVRCVVLTAKGRAFCAGANIGMLSGNDGEDGARLLYAVATQLHETVINPIRRMAKPGIAAINGTVAGAGVGLMLGCGLRIAAAEAVVTIAYSGIGVSPDGSTSFFLPRLVGVAKAMELYLFNDRLTAEQAQHVGLFNRVVPGASLLGFVQEMAKQLSTGPTFAYGQTKHLFNRAFSNDLPTQLDDEARAIALCASTDDFKEGLAAFLAKRSPHYVGK